MQSSDLVFMSGFYTVLAFVISPNRRAWLLSLSISSCSKPSSGRLLSICGFFLRIFLVGPCLCWRKAPCLLQVGLLLDSHLSVSGPGRKPSDPAFSDWYVSGLSLYILLLSSICSIFHIGLNYVCTD